ncbi:4'-phosphopantetheinyl transferase superfamily protein [Xanthobacter sp. KR7-65]|uniref:4'-phosphopantetheinyl transferase family protein n=1 Tax=Xanthobacter sp. KR7-65 TaxID=3156612 RepID=UPI0032B3C0DF
MCEVVAGPLEAARLAPGASLVAIGRVANLAGHDTFAFDLPQDDEARITRLVKADDRADRRAAWRLARRLAGIALACDPAGVALFRATSGRPFLPAGCGHDLNVAHASGWVAVGLARATPATAERNDGGIIGVDVERARDLDLWTRLAGEFMHPEDIDLWSRLPTEQRPAAALAQWCGKEALLKATGEGLSADPCRVRLPAAGGVVTRHGQSFLTGAGTLPDAAYAFAVDGPAPRIFLATATGWDELNR